MQNSEYMYRKFSFTEMDNVSFVKGILCISSFHIFRTCANFHLCSQSPESCTLVFILRISASAFKKRRVFACRSDAASRVSSFWRARTYRRSWVWPLGRGMASRSVWLQGFGNGFKNGFTASAVWRRRRFARSGGASWPSSPSTQGEAGARLLF